MLVQLLTMAEVVILQYQKQPELQMFSLIPHFSIVLAPQMLITKDLDLKFIRQARLLFLIISETKKSRAKKDDTRIYLAFPSTNGKASFCFVFSEKIQLPLGLIFTFKGLLVLLHLHSLIQHEAMACLHQGHILDYSSLPMLFYQLHVKHSSFIFYILLEGRW
jgi:hypothetical protein